MPSENTHDRRSETKERLKVGGIIASCCVAVASFIYSFFKYRADLGENPAN